MTAYQRVRLHDIADDLFLLTRMEGRTIHEGVASSGTAKGTGIPVLQTSDDDEVLHIAHGRMYRKAWRRRDGTIGTRVIGLDADASAVVVARGGRVAVGLQNGVVCVRGADDVAWRRMRGHVGRVHAVDLSEGAVASGGEDRTIRVRRAGRQDSGCVLRGHGGGVRWVQGLGGGRYASHGGPDARVKLWDARRGACVATARLATGVRSIAVGGGSGGHDVVYAAAGPAVHVLDARAGLCTACVLSIPRAWRHADSAAGEGGAGTVRALALRADGTLAGAVGGGGVAVWDARGAWEARGLGWPRRWDGRDGKALAAIHIRGRCVIAGGGGNELLTFALDGSHDGLLPEAAAPAGPITWIGSLGPCVAVARVGGSVRLLDPRTASVDWRGARRVVRDQAGAKASQRFWDHDHDPLNRALSPGAQHAVAADRAAPNR